MKKESTNLTVAVSVVTRARALVARSPFTPSVAKLAEAILTQAFDAIESGTSSPQLPIIQQLRQHIHGETTVQQNIDATVAKATSGAGNSDLEATIRRIMQQELAAREPKPPKRKAS